MTDQVKVAATRGDHMANVDASDDPQARVRYLDIATSQFNEYKQESYALLALGPGMSVLDVGCGAGDDVRALAGIVGPTGKAVGLDLSSTMVEQARARARDLPVKFVQGSVYELPFPDDTFDASRSDRVFQHLDEPLQALQEMVRVTKPRGRINVVDPDWVRDAYEAGDATLEEAEAWEREMRERAATGRFFAAAGGIGVVGTVPSEGQ
jgi:SAM-dependent methyltransferase